MLSKVEQSYSCGISLSYPSSSPLLLVDSSSTLAFEKQYHNVGAAAMMIYLKTRTHTSTGSFIKQQSDDTHMRIPAVKQEDCNINRWLFRFWGRTSFYKWMNIPKEIHWLDSLLGWGWCLYGLKLLSIICNGSRCFLFQLVIIICRYTSNGCIWNKWNWNYNM